MGRINNEYSAKSRFLSAEWIGPRTVGIIKKLPEIISFASLEEAESILKQMQELAWSYYYDDNQQRMYDAFLIFQLLADCDDTCGLDMVGQMLYSGKGCEKNYSAAIPYLRKAADAGANVSQYLLGYCYDKGLGIQKNEEEAIKYFELAALQDNSLAQYDLARIYHLKFIASKKSQTTKFCGSSRKYDIFSG